jgi:hypothetical protein
MSVDKIYTMVGDGTYTCGRQRKQDEGAYVKIFSSPQFYCSHCRGAMRVISIPDGSFHLACDNDRCKRFGIKLIAPDNCGCQEQAFLKIVENGEE